MPGASLRSLSASLTLTLSACVGGASAVAGQEPPGAPVPDSAALHAELQGAVDAYERSRRRLAPADWFPRATRGCDQYIGRMCLTLGAGADWWFPETSPEAMEEARLRLIGRLADGVQALPGDAWLLGQLVRYLGEGREWELATTWLDPCPPVDRAWCQVLEGTALHGAGRYRAAEASFREALSQMPPSEFRSWIAPGEVVDGEVEDLIEDLEDAESWEELDTLMERFWSLSDPFKLVEGNDRLTEHLARRTLVEAQYGRASAYRGRFRDDLAEVTVRYGWEVGWERRPQSMATPDSEISVVGHQHPYALPWVAPEAALLDPASSTARDWTPQSEAIPRTGYAPLYAPNILPDGEVLVFPRGREAIVAAAISLPPDTSWHAGHDHPPLPRLPTFAGRPAVSGLFGLDPDGRVVDEDRRTFPVLVGVELEDIPEVLPAPVWHDIVLPVGDWIVSVEHIVPDLARGARMRRGLRIEERLLDQPTLSDLLLIPGGSEPPTLEVALEGEAVQWIRPGDPVRVGWETWGLGRRRETFTYTLVLEEADGGVVRRVAGWLGLGGDDVVADLTWTELGPEQLGAHFRSIELGVPADLDEGEYRLRLELKTQGRERLLSERPIRVRR